MGLFYTGTSLKQQPMLSFIQLFFRFYNRFLSPDKLFAKRLRSLIGFTPSNIGIFKLAFYHKSASSEKLYAVQSNERLEYLGDAVLGTIVAEYLFKKYPNKDEGFLTKMRSKIVKRQSLNKIADKMGLDVFLNQYNNTRLSRSMLGNALEALVGAVYIECGYRKTRRYVIQKILRGYLDIHELESFDDNYKSQLLEWCQKNGQTVSYKMLAKYKFEKRDRFKVAVLIDGKKLASADDFNKKSAEQTASEKAMQILGLLDENEEEEKRGRSKTSKSKSSGKSERRPSSRKKQTNPQSKSTSQKPATRNQQAKSSQSKPTSRNQSKTSTQNPSRTKNTQTSNPKSTSQKPATRNQQAQAKNSQPKTRNPQPKTQNPKSESTTRNPQAKNPKSQSKSTAQKPTSRNPKSQNQQPTKNTSQSPNKKSGAKQPPTRNSQPKPKPRNPQPKTQNQTKTTQPETPKPKNTTHNPHPKKDNPQPKKHKPKPTSRNPKNSKPQKEEIDEVEIPVNLSGKLEKTNESVPIHPKGESGED